MAAQRAALLACACACLLSALPAAPAPADPPCPTRAPPSPSTLCIISADDAGTAAAWAAGVLGLPAVVTTWDARDVGGDVTSAVRTDLFTSARNAGGLNYVYDRFARRASDTPSGMSGTARVAPPGASFAFLHGVLTESPVVSPPLSLLTGWMPLPGSGRVDAAGRVTGLTLVAENGTTCALACKYVVEGSNEGYALKAFNVSTRFGREGVRNETGGGRGPPCSDATNCGESMAGRRVFGRCGPSSTGPDAPRVCNTSDFVMGLAPPWANVSDVGEEEEDVSMAASALLALRQYADATALVDVRADAPWLLTAPPAGYDEGSYAFLANVSAPPTEGYIGGGVHRCSMEHTYGLPRWYEVADPGSGVRVHYLRVGGNPWLWKRGVEERSLGYAVGALYYLQSRTGMGRGWGLDNTTYTDEFPSATTLSRLGTSAYGGDNYSHVSSRLYHRVNTRLSSPASAVGGEAMLPRPLFLPPAAVISRTLWEPEALGVPLYPVDYRGVLSDTVPMPEYAGPEGLVSLVYGDLGGTDVHGLHRRVLEPDRTADGPYVRNLLSPGAPRTTFQAQAAVRIHATASNLGLAAVSLIAATERGCPTCNATDDAPTVLAQWIMASSLSGVLSFSDGGLAGGPSFTLSQLPGVYGVPPGQIGRDWASPLPTRGETYLWWAMYANGVVGGAIPRWPAPPSRRVSPRCPLRPTTRRSSRGRTSSRCWTLSCRAAVGRACPCPSPPPPPPSTSATSAQS